MVAALGNKRWCQGQSYEVEDQYDAKTVKTFVPFGSLIAILPFKCPDMESGLVMPDGSKGSIDIPRAEVIAVGPDCKHVREGDIVLIAHDKPGARFRNAGFNYQLFREDAVWGIIRNDAAKTGE